MQSALESNAARRFVLQLLKSTRKNSNASLDLISIYASCSRELSRKFVAELGIPVRDGSLQLSRTLRLDLAMAESNRGFLHEASRYLEWQDFERFAERCLSQLGFETMRDVRVKGEGRSWQIDVIGIKGQLVTCLDCKHWEQPVTPSRFKNSELHQSKATKLFASKLAEERDLTITSLPVILTLFEPPQRVLGRAVLVAVQKLPSMLSELTPYTSGLPFITVNSRAENPIS